MRPVRGRDADLAGGVGLPFPFTDDPKLGDELEKRVVDEVNGQIFYIAKTCEGFGYDELVAMPEYERKWWYERCVEHNEKADEEMRRAQSRAKGGRSRKR